MILFSVYFYGPWNLYVAFHVLLLNIIKCIEILRKNTDIFIVNK